MSAILLSETKEIVFSFVGYQCFSNFVFRLSAVVMPVFSKQFRIKVPVAGISDDFQASLSCYVSYYHVKSEVEILEELGHFMNAVGSLLDHVCPVSAVCSELDLSV
ncbi:MAG TPA: hypothetical protein ACFCUD_14035 [Cyclobacteriaceae bacterium]